MRLRIDPRVDFACKLMLGSPEHPAVTIHFLNSVLRLVFPIDSIRMLEDLLGVTQSEVDLLMAQTLDALTARVSDLQQRLRARQA